MQESVIFWENAKHLGVDLSQYYLMFGREVAKKISKKNKTYSIICGTDGNGADGLAIAGLLAEEDVRKITVYVIGRVKNAEHPIFNFLYKNLKAIEDEDFLKIKQDCFAEEIEPADFVVECLAGTGLHGDKLTKRYRDVIKRISHFYAKKIAIDLPVFHYTPDSTYSLIYAKTEEAEVISIKIPESVELFCGPGEKLFLDRPNTKTHKSKNGRLLILDFDANLDQNILKSLHREFPVDIDVFSMNRKPVRKSSLNYILSENLKESLEKCNSILISSINKDYITEALLEKIIEEYPEKNFIMEGSIYLDLKEKLGSVQNKAVVFYKHSSKESNRAFATKNNLHCVFYGVSTLLFNPIGEMRKVVGMQKQKENLLFETALYSTQNNLWLSSRASLG